MNLGDGVSRVARIAWFVAAGLSLFAFENIWVDGRIRARFHRVPSLVPEPLSGVWVLVFALILILSVLLVMAVVLVFRDENIGRGKKLSLGGFAICALGLCCAWVFVTGEISLTSVLSPIGRPHTVTLRWQPSTSKVEGYDVYRSFSPGGPFEKINTELVRQPWYVDRNVRNGVKYYYTVRAVDGKGHESGNSNLATADIPWLPQLRLE